MCRIALSLTVAAAWAIWPPIFLKKAWCTSLKTFSDSKLSDQVENCRELSEVRLVVCPRLACGQPMSSSWLVPAADVRSQSVTASDYDLNEKTPEHRKQGLTLIS